MQGVIFFLLVFPAIQPTPPNLLPRAEVSCAMGLSPAPIYLVSSKSFFFSSLFVPRVFDDLTQLQTFFRSQIVGFDLQVLHSSQNQGFHSTFR